MTNLRSIIHLRIIRSVLKQEDVFSEKAALKIHYRLLKLEKDWPSNSDLNDPDNWDKELAKD